MLHNLYLKSRELQLNGEEEEKDKSFSCAIVGHNCGRVHKRRGENKQRFHRCTCDTTRCFIERTFARTSGQKHKKLGQKVNTFGLQVRGVTQVGRAVVAQVKCKLDASHKVRLLICPLNFSMSTVREY